LRDYNPVDQHNLYEIDFDLLHRYHALATTSSFFGAVAGD